QPGREAYLQGLRDLAYVDGRNVVIEFPWVEGKPERPPALAAELAALKVDVIVAGGGTLGALAAKRATTRSRSFSPTSAIRWRTGSSRAWHGPVAMRRGCARSSPSSSASAWSSCSRWPRTPVAWLFS